MTEIDFLVEVITGQKLTPKLMKLMKERLAYVQANPVQTGPPQAAVRQVQGQLPQRQVAVLHHQAQPAASAVAGNHPVSEISGKRLIPGCDEHGKQIFFEPPIDDAPLPINPGDSTARIQAMGGKQAKHGITLPEVLTGEHTRGPRKF